MYSLPTPKYNNLLSYLKEIAFLPTKFSTDTLAVPISMFNWQSWNLRVCLSTDSLMEISVRIIFCSPRYHLSSRTANKVVNSSHEYPSPSDFIMFSPSPRYSLCYSNNSSVISISAVLRFRVLHQKRAEIFHFGI